MNEDSATQPTGWYHAVGDPAGTVRYWDGGNWWGEPQENFSEAAPEVRAVSSQRERRTGMVLPVAAYPRRAAAALFDFALYAMNMVIVWQFRAPITSLVDQVKAVPLAFDFAVLTELWATVAVLLVVPTLLEFMGLAVRGSSIGKRLFSLAVVRRRGEQVPGLRAAFLRAVFKVFLVPLGGFMVITGIWMISGLNRSAQVAFILLTLAVVCVPAASARRRAVWDLLAGTEVVSSRSDV
jgi:uncharacterized RDD family membrane protein YckC